MDGSFERDSAQYQHLVVNRIASMLAYWDNELHCRFANRAYETWFGVKPESLLGTSIRDLLGPQLFALNQPHIEAALRGEEQLFERVVPGPDGVQRHSLAHYIPDIVDRVVRGFFVQVTDVTQLKETEAALLREQALRAEVQRHVQALDAMLRERDEILDVLAHEVRQPLTNAAAALQSIESALAQLGDQASWLRFARAQAVTTQVMASIDNLLAVVSLLARPEPIEREDADVDTLLALAVADMPTGERGRIRVERATPTRTATMNLNLMRLALRNLLSNALKYSPADAPVIVRLSDREGAPALLIDVVDVGSGIEPGFVPHLFERGSRGSHASDQPGHGLGLHIVQRVMAVHGGSVELVQNGASGATLRLVVDQSQPN
jgi:two-component system, OmpR family, sensor kinase